MTTVEYPPGHSDPIHRHNAHVFVYVLEGSIVMQVRGGKEVTLTPGQTFYEGPNDVHIVGRNASQTKPAKFVVFFIHPSSSPFSVPTPFRHKKSPLWSFKMNGSEERQQISIQAAGCEPIWDSETAAVYLHIHPRTLTRMARNREIPGFQIGTHWRFRQSDLDEWMRLKVISHSKLKPCPRQLERSFV